MQKTENISIGKRPFICDLDAYKVIREYLDRAEVNLKTDPDKEDIITDIEISMAKHFEEVSKSLVIDKESAQKVLEMMGEVVSLENNDNENDGDNKSSDTASHDKADKFFKTELYKDHERGILSGVCAGIARSIDVNPFWVRATFVLFALFTKGIGGIAVYIVLALSLRSGPTNARTAGQIIEEVKEKSRNVHTWATQMEYVLQRIVRFSIRTVVVSVQLSLLASLIILGSVWSIVLFFMITNPSKVVLFGNNPALVDFISVLSVGLVILVPLFVLITQLAGSKMARNVRFVITVWCIWTLSLLIGVGSLVNAVPDVRDRLVRDQPQTRNIFVEVQDGKIMHSCLSLWGDCRSPEPAIYTKSMCGVEIRMVSDTDHDLQSMQNRSWDVINTSIDYPVVESDYCDFIKNESQFHPDSVVFADQRLNNERHVIENDFYDYPIGSTVPTGRTPKKQFVIFFYRR